MFLKKLAKQKFHKLNCQMKTKTVLTIIMLIKGQEPPTFHTVYAKIKEQFEISILLQMKNSGIVSKKMEVNHYSEISLARHLLSSRQ